MKRAELHLQSLVHRLWGGRWSAAWGNRTTVEMSRSGASGRSYLQVLPASKGKRNRRFRRAGQSWPIMATTVADRRRVIAHVCPVSRADVTTDTCVADLGGKRGATAPSRACALTWQVTRRSSPTPNGVCRGSWCMRARCLPPHRAPVRHESIGAIMSFRSSSADCRACPSAQG